MPVTPKLQIPLVDYGQLDELSTGLNQISTGVDNAVGVATRDGVTGLATLDDSGKVPAAQLPTLLDTLASASGQAAVLAALGIARGASAVNFPNSQYSEVATVEHGLPGIPTFVGFSSGGYGPGALQLGFAIDGALTSTSFSVIGWCADAAINDSAFEFFWIAVL